MKCTEPAFVNTDGPSSIPDGPQATSSAHREEGSSATVYEVDFMDTVHVT